MCGLAGWVDYRGDAQAGVATLDRMIETMRLRGPDAGGTWLSHDASIGHRRLAVIDAAGGAQPMVVKRPDGTAEGVLAYTGEVYNFRILRRDLESAGVQFRTRSDTEVVLHALRFWGVAAVERFEGMFAFAYWDVEARTLHLVRDRLGIKPLYFAATQQGVVFGSEPKAVLAHPGFRGEIDDDSLRQLLSGVKVPGRAVWRNLEEVRPGTIVTCSPAGLSKRTYWRLERRPREDDTAATVATVRGLLEEIVGDQLVADVPLCSLLSGGLDSSAVSALAARHNGHIGEPLRTVSVDFAGHSDRYASGQHTLTHDAPFAELMARHLGTDHEEVLLQWQQLADPDVRRSVLTARDLPLECGDFDVSLHLLSKAVRTRSTVALSGEGADELFAGYSWFHDPGATTADTFPWTRGVRPGPSIALPLFSAGLLGQLDLDGFRSECYLQARGEVPHDPADSSSERKRREISYLNLVWYLPTLLDRKDRMSMATGLEVRVPFCEHRLVDYVFNASWSQQTFDGSEKSLLRAAVTDLLPDEVLQRRKNPFPLTKEPAYGDALAAALRAVVHDPAPHLFDIVDPALAKAAATQAPDIRGPARWDGIERVLAFDDWLRRYKPSFVGS